MHFPPINSDAVAPETVHTVGVVELKETARPEVAVADNASVEAAYSVAVMAGKLMVRVAITTKLCLTGVAAP